MTEIVSDLKNLLGYTDRIDTDSLTGNVPEIARLMESVSEQERNFFGDRDFWFSLLYESGKTEFLRKLPDRDARYRWSEAVFKIIDHTGYTLLDHLNMRTAEHATRTFLHDSGGASPTRWSYQYVSRYLKQIAATLFSIDTNPRTAIFTDNCIEGASVDISCMLYDILVTPLNIHFDLENLAWIFDKLEINIAVADSEERLHRLMELQGLVQNPFTIVVTDPKNRFIRDEDVVLNESCTKLTNEEIDDYLDKRKMFDIHDVCTVMFTSGSTGRPKGVCFTKYNLVTKRFARAAALPAVGDNEVLLSYLPLYHTFGRYFELLGMLYWGGTYVFAGNPSLETLLSRLKDIQPTGLIGIPLRWQQIRDTIQNIAGDTAPKDVQQKVCREVIGSRLRWGLSAAGYLDPAVFRFFQRNGVELCSGFGMTEATGGITMTPPGEYEDNSVGIPLPGARTSFSEKGELLISGPYIARYLEIFEGRKMRFDALRDSWFLPTGDLFKVRESGHHEIVDRIKDIYKNNRGQTVAPRRVEQQFENVPGIKRTFLVGDARDYNVLLIIPEEDELVEELARAEESDKAYFHRLVTAANSRLAPYERVVNFEVLDRDFEKDRDELTPKGSFKRKNITANFKELIDSLYESAYREIQCKDIKVKIPRWFYRDKSVLESDIEYSRGKLYNSSLKKHLRISRTDAEGVVRIGDLEYCVKGDVVDLGLFARQPRLWSGNPELMRFCPLKEGWEVPLGVVDENVFLPERTSPSAKIIEINKIKTSGSTRLRNVNKIIFDALYGGVRKSLAAVDELSKMLRNVDDHLRSIIRTRLELLARHPEERVRCRAYMTLLVDDPMPDYTQVFPAFVKSGKSFLNEETMSILSKKNIERTSLEALRKRFLSYRTFLEWPASDIVREQFENLLLMMSKFAINNPEYYSTVRAELATWILHRDDTKLSARAERILRDLVDWYEEDLAERVPRYSRREWDERLVFDESISKFEIEKMKDVFIQTTFLYQSITLAFDTDTFDLRRVVPGGIWISRILSQRDHHRYRVSVNIDDGKHYDLLLTLREDYREETVMELLYRMITISGYPYQHPPVPQFGCCRPELGAMSVVFIGDLTVWERIREYSSVRSYAFIQRRRNFLQKLLTRGMATYFAILRNSGFTVLPQIISPVNTVVPEPDFRREATVLSMSGCRYYTGPISLIRPLVKNFYDKTIAHYPWTQKTLMGEWIFDACMEELGEERGREFLDDLLMELEREEVFTPDGSLFDILNKYITSIDSRFRAPMSVKFAIDRYEDWIEANPKSTQSAREEMSRELYRLYRVDRFSETARYYLYRNTYFSDSHEETQVAFDRLLDTLVSNPGTSATRLMELSELQNSIPDKLSRHVFSTVVFPHAKRIANLDVLAIGDTERKQVILQSHILDRDGVSYSVREPTKPAEIASLYKMFLRQKYPKTISEHDKFYIALDDHDRIIGGVCYRYDHDFVVHLDGIIVSQTLMNKGLGSSLLEDFCDRMTNQNMKIVKTHYFLKAFYRKRKFTVDKRWGGLVRFLDETVEV